MKRVQRRKRFHTLKEYHQPQYTTMVLENLPPRNKSQRLIEKKQKLNLEAKHAKRVISDAQESDICLGLNEFTDSLHAFPQDIISYFTLLKEIEAKCVYTMPHLQAYIKRFLTMRKDHPKRGLLLTRIRDCIREIMPCLEEKMHVATIASNQVKKYVNKMDQAYDIIINHEIPEIIRIGPMWEPCMKVSEPKTAHQQRSESRREALAAKKAKSGSTFEEEYDNTAAEDSAAPLKKNTKFKKESRAQQNSNVNTQINSTNNATSKKRKTGAGNVDDEYNYGKQISYNTNGKNGNSNSNNTNGSNSQATKKNKNNKTRKETKKDANGINTSNGNIAGNNNNNSSNNTENSRTNKGRNGSGGSDHSDHGGNKAKKETEKEELPTSPINYEGEPVYCYCQQVSYGEMVGCDGDHCEKEWFHLPCTGLKELPKGEWYCDDCKSKMGIK
jgi:inhibitor of growth protein 3